MRAKKGQKDMNGLHFTLFINEWEFSGISIIQQGQIVRNLGRSWDDILKKDSKDVFQLLHSKITVTWEKTKGDQIFHSIFGDEDLVWNFYLSSQLLDEFRLIAEESTKRNLELIEVEKLKEENSFLKEEKIKLENFITSLCITAQKEEKEKELLFNENEQLREKLGTSEQGLELNLGDQNKTISQKVKERRGQENKPPFNNFIKRTYPSRDEILNQKKSSKNATPHRNF
jgi:hypothetical protein